MKRAPIIVSSTAVGLGLVLSFHTHKPTATRISTGSAAGGATATTLPGGTSSTTVGAGKSGTSEGHTGASSTVPASNASRTATSQDIQYRYGDIQLQVTEQGTRITNIEVVQNGAADMRSQEINSQAVPLLQSQAMSAQSAQIDGVSGATFTSDAYAQSLQSALDQLKR